MKKHHADMAYSTIKGLALFASPKVARVLGFLKTRLHVFFLSKVA
jgi:hypothetical protein